MMQFAYIPKIFPSSSPRGEVGDFECCKSEITVVYFEASLQNHVRNTFSPHLLLILTHLGVQSAPVGATLTSTEAAPAEAKSV